MRCVIQRVKKSSVKINDGEERPINKGLLLLLGIEDADTDEDINWLVGKILQMRIFSDEDGKMNLSIQDIKGQLLVISQFTLHASTKKGNRPSFINAAKPEYAKVLYLRFIEILRSQTDLLVKEGEFGADMVVTIVNDGPVTIVMDSQKKE